MTKNFLPKTFLTPSFLFKEADESMVSVLESIDTDSNFTTPYSVKVNFEICADPKENSNYYLVLSNGQPLASFTILLSKTNDIGIELTLAPALRGQGLGSRIVDEFINYAKQINPASIISLSINPKNEHAKKQVAKLGFEMVRNTGMDEYELKTEDYKSKGIRMPE